MMKPHKVMRNEEQDMKTDGSLFDFSQRSHTTRLFYFEIGKKTLEMSHQEASDFSKDEIEEIGRTVEPHIISSEVPTLLEVQKRIAEPKDLSRETVDFDVADNYRKQLLLETVSPQKRKEIIKTVALQF